MAGEIDTHEGRSNKRQKETPFVIGLNNKRALFRSAGEINRARRTSLILAHPPVRIRALLSIMMCCLPVFLDGILLPAHVSALSPHELLLEL